MVGLPPGITASGQTYSGTPTTPGTYTVTLVCPNITVIYPFQINGPFTASPTSLTMTGVAGGTAVKAALQVGQQTGGQTFTVTAAGGAWLTTTGSGTSPSAVSVTANPAALAAGTYNGTVTVKASGPITTSVAVAVRFTVTAAPAPKLSATPSSLAFTSVRAGAPITKTVVISNAGTGSVGPMNFRVVGAFNSNPPEIEPRISVSPSSGTVTATTPLTLSITLNPNLSGKTYYADVVGSASAGDLISIPLSIQIGSPKLWWSQNAIYLGAFGDSAGLVRQPVSKTLGLYTDATSMNVFTDIWPGGLTPAAPWLSLSPSPGRPNAFRLTPTGAGIAFNVTSAGLLAGDYYGTVTAYELTGGPAAAGVTVVFRVVPSGAPGGFFSTDLTNALTFEGSGRIAVAPPLAFNLTTIDTTPLSVTLSLEFNEGQAFASVSPTAGSLVAGSPLTITLRQILSTGVGPGNLPDAPNIVTGNVVVQRGNGLGPVKIPFALIKRLANQAATPVRAADCVPTALFPLRAAPFENFSAMAGIPEDINVTVVDDCGAYDTVRSVTARFSNRDAPVELQLSGKGVFTGSWSGRTVSESVVMTISATSADPAVSGTIEVSGSLAANPKQPPLVFDGGILNGGSFAVGQPLAPGSFVTLFGEKLASATLKASSVPLAKSLAGAEILIGGQLAPVFFASDGQVNAILPYGLPTGGPLPVLLARDGVFSPLRSLSIVPAAPGIFMYGNSQAIAVGPNGVDLIDSAHIVRAGQTIVVYCTGLGEVSPAVPAGTQTPLTVLSKTVETVTATIGGVTAKVDFAGLTPGQTGLYQVNMVVPTGVAAGDRVPIVLQAAGTASSAAYISVR